MMKLLKNKHGMTMIELIVGMLVFSIIAISVSTILVPTLRAYAKANDLAEINTLLDNLSAEILDDISRADKVTLSGGSTNLRIETNVNTVIYDIGASAPNEGLLCRDGTPVLHEDYYKGKTVRLECYQDDKSALLDDGTISHDTISDGTMPSTFYVRMTLISSEGNDMASRDYAVNLFLLG